MKSALARWIEPYQQKAGPATSATIATCTPPAVADVATVAIIASLSPEDSISDEFEERAGIMEFDGGLSREEAERLAGFDCVMEG